jgi:hypothetical protein
LRSSESIRPCFAYLLPPPPFPPPLSSHTVVYGHDLPPPSHRPSYQATRSPSCLSILRLFSRPILPCPGCERSSTPSTPGWGGGERGGRETGREGEEEKWKWMRPGFQGIGHAWQWGERSEGREGGREGEGGRNVPKNPKEEAAQKSKSRW